ncbi:hypothetical protein ES703_18360 [subsurface metagenome]
MSKSHHTLADWDFEYGAQYRSLASDYFISAPTSLKHTLCPATILNTVLCRIPETQCLPQGEVRIWCRRYAGGFYPAIFRNQAALGTSNDINCYQIDISGNTAFFYRRLNHIPTLQGQTPCYNPAEEWVHYRVFWYNGKTPGDADALCVDIYVEVAGEWYKQGNTMYDTNPYWGDSEINRCGFGVQLLSGHTRWHDDTEIWGPV